MSNMIKFITLTQPWATLVALGVKRIETRSWRTPYRGLLGIHAAKSYPDWAREFSDTPRSKFCGISLMRRSVVTAAEVSIGSRPPAASIRG